MTQGRLKIGDIIEIPLPNRKKAYAHYFGKNKWGDLLAVFDYSSDANQVFRIENLQANQYKFGPLLTRIMLGIKSPTHKWKIVGNIPLTNLSKPHFIWKDGGPLSKGITTKWYVYDGVESKEVGKHLPDEFKKLEYMTNYSPGSLVKRILTNKSIDQDLISKG